MFSNLYAIASNFTSSNKEGKNNENNNNKDEIEDKEIYIFNSLIMICSLIPENDLGNNLENVINLFRINLEKGKNKQNELLCKSFYTFLEFNIEKIKGRLSSLIEIIINSLFQLITNENISLNVKVYEENFLQLKNEILKLFIILSSNFSETTINFLIFKIDSNDILEKITSVIILKTVLLHFSNIQDSQNQKLMTTILKVSHETDFEFKCCLFELIYVIFKQDLIKKENIGNELLSFLIKESEYDESNINNINNENYPFLSNSKFVIEQAEFTLLNILNKIEFEKIFDHVYPYIFTVFINKFYDKCQFIICKMINTIFDNALKTNNQIDEKIKENEKDENSNINIEPNYISLRLDYKKYPLLPYSQNILIKMLLILSNPLLKNNFISIALLTLKNILTLLSHSEDTLINQNIKSDKIEEYISKNKNYFNYCDYYELLTELFNEILKYDNQDENNTKSNIQFISLCLQVINDYIIEYKNNNNIISILMCFEGVILGKINLTESIDLIINESKDDKNQENKNMKFNLITYLSKTLEEFVLLNDNNFNINDNDKQFENWIIYLTCTLLYYLDGNKNISKCIEKILKAYKIDISNIDFSEQNKFINSFSKLFINIFNIEKIFELLNKFIYLSNSNISNVSELSTNIIINIISNTPGYFLNKISLDEEKETKIDNKFLNKFYRKYINILDKSIKEDESKTTLRIKNLLKISQTISKINYDIILSYSLDKKTI